MRREKKQNWQDGEESDEMGGDEKQNWSFTRKQEVEQEEVMEWLGESMREGGLVLITQRSEVRDALVNWCDSMVGWCRAYPGGWELGGWTVKKKQEGEKREETEQERLELAGFRCRSRYDEVIEQGIRVPQNGEATAQCWTGEWESSS